MMSAFALEWTKGNEIQVIIATKEVPVCYERYNEPASFPIVAQTQYGERDDSVRIGLKLA
jgi:hypothetical protein